jgi:UDP-2,3-diacylglucosamine pyrophosphatase LpxH
MLRIGDIHITSQHMDDIIPALRDRITSSGETSIIFLGDYVYHFSYDRQALLGFFALLVGLQSDGYNIYLLAGNHDRIQ